MNHYGGDIGPCVSMIGTLPPLKGISPYCAELSLRLCDHIGLEFIDFRRLYPERLYPGGSKEPDLYPVELGDSAFDRKTILDIYNPLSWIKAGFSIKGSVVHAQWWTGVLAPVYYTVLAIARLRGKRVVITIHNAEPHEKNPVYRILHRSILPLGDEYIVHSESNRDTVLMKTGGSEKPVHVVPHIPFLSAGYEYDHSDREEARKRLGIEKHVPVIVFFGNIREYKGLDILLKAMPEIISAFPDVVLIIMGQPWEEWDKYQRIIEQNGIGENLRAMLHYLPFKELREHLVASDLVVFPFKTLDSASGSVVLARSLRKPVVISDIGCMKDVKGDGVFRVKPGCPVSLASSINDALHQLEMGSIISNRENGFDTCSGDVVSMHLRIYEGLHGATNQSSNKGCSMGMLSSSLESWRNRLISRYVDGDVLDLGCGPARILEYLSPGQRYVGIDRKGGLIARLESVMHRENTTFYCADLNDIIPDEIAGFGTILMVAVIEHLENPGNVLQMIRGKLSDGGVLLITTPTPFGIIVHRWLASIRFTSKDAVESHLNVYTREHLAEILASAGFRIDDYHRFQLGLNQLFLCRKRDV